MDKLERTPEEEASTVAEIISGAVLMNHPDFKLDVEVVYTEDKEHGIGPTYTVSIDTLYVLQDPHCTADELVNIFVDYIQDLRMMQAIIVRMVDVDTWYFIERSRLDNGDGRITESDYCELTYTAATKTWVQKVAGEIIPEPNIPDISQFT